MEQENIDHIMEKQFMGPLQQRIQLYWVFKAGKMLHQAKWLTQGQVQKKFPHLMGEHQMKWRPFLPKGGGLVQADIGGHPPIPLSQSTIFHFGIFSTLFRVLNIKGHFNAINNVFWGQ
jgi:hypothetical protein